MSEPESPRVPAWACALERGMTAAENAVDAAAPTVVKVFLVAAVIVGHAFLLIGAMNSSPSLMGTCIAGALVAIIDLFGVTIAFVIVCSKRYGSDWEERARCQRAGEPRPGEEPLPLWVLAADCYLTALEAFIDWFMETLAVPILFCCGAACLVLLNLYAVVLIAPETLVGSLLDIAPADPVPFWAACVVAALVFGGDAVAAYFGVVVGFPRLFGDRWRERCRSHRERSES